MLRLFTARRPSIILSAHATAAPRVCSRRWRSDIAAPFTVASEQLHAIQHAEPAPSQRHSHSHADSRPRHQLRPKRRQQQLGSSLPSPNAPPPTAAAPSLRQQYSTIRLSMLSASKRGDFATVERLVSELLTLSRSDAECMPDRSMIHAWLKCFERRGDWVGAERCWAQLHTLPVLTPSAERKQRTPLQLLLRLQIERVDAMSYRLMMQTYLIAAGGIGSPALSVDPTAPASPTSFPAAPAPEQLFKVFPLYEEMRSRGLHFSAFDFGRLIETSVRSGHDAFATRWAREAESRGVFDSLDNKVQEQLHEAHRRLLTAPRNPNALNAASTHFCAPSLLPVSVALEQWDSLTASEQNQRDCLSPDFFPAMYVGLVHERKLLDADRIMSEYMKLQSMEGAQIWSLETVNAWLKAYASPRGKGQLTGAMKVWARMHYAGITPLAKTYTLMLCCLVQDESPEAKRQSQVLSRELFSTKPAASSSSPSSSRSSSPSSDPASSSSLGSSPSAPTTATTAAAESDLDKTHPHLLGPPMPPLLHSTLSAGDFASLIAASHQAGLQQAARKWGIRARKAGLWDQLDAAHKVMADPEWTEESEEASALAAADASLSLSRTPVPMEDRPQRCRDLVREWKTLHDHRKRVSPLLHKALQRASNPSIADELMSDPIAQARFDASVQLANAYLYTHVRLGHWRGADQLWARMQSHGPEPDVRSYRTMMQVYCRAGIKDLEACLKRSDQLYKQMTRGNQPTTTTTGADADPAAAVAPADATADGTAASSDSPSSLPPPATAPAAPATPSPRPLSFSADDLDTLICASWKARHEMRQGRRKYYSDEQGGSEGDSLPDPPAREAAALFLLPERPPPSLESIIERRRACALLAEHVLAWGLRATAADLWNDLSREARNAVQSARALQQQSNRVARLNQLKHERMQRASLSSDSNAATAANADHDADAQASSQTPVPRDN